uniref:Peptidase C19 ubiquitin carboxyl-terminal hydrolase domain-containing protein n=1 Tax=Lactuca sativa TaxID=4236 RepID=A0A9R1UD10_LACSA|nr:hypothetical protein LSAT_V11C900481680 [Lactuca sativa]
MAGFQLQMTWQTSLLLKKRKNGEFLAQQDKKIDCSFCLLEKKIVRSFSIDSTLDTPGKIIGGLNVFAEHFRLGRQEDAHEFLRCLTAFVPLSDGCVRRTEFNYGIKEEKHGFIEGYVPISYLSAFLQSQSPTLESELDDSTLLTFDFFG